MSYIEDARCLKVNLRQAHLLQFFAAVLSCGTAMRWITSLCKPVQKNTRGGE